jgi:hypothetical protein
VNDPFGTPTLERLTQSDVTYPETLPSDTTKDFEITPHVSVALQTIFVVTFTDDKLQSGGTAVAVGDAPGGKPEEKGTNPKTAKEGDIRPVRTPIGVGRR